MGGETREIMDEGKERDRDRQRVRKRRRSAMRKFVGKTFVTLAAL